MGCAQSTPSHNSSSQHSRLFRQLFGNTSSQEEEDNDERRRTRGASSSSSSRQQRREEQEDILKTKVVLLGDSGVGKSCIVNRFATNTFDVDSRVTVGAAFVARTIEVNKSDKDESVIKTKKPTQTARRVKFEIWDTAGQERYESLANLYYRRAHVAIVVFALDDEKSFEKARFWINELKEKCEKRDALIILCGNKMDKITDEHEDRIEEPSSSSRGGNGGDEIVEDDDGNAVFVSMDRANRMANELGCHMCVTSSAKTGEGVEELFFEVARTLLRKQRNGGGKSEATNGVDGGTTTAKKMKTKKAKKKTRSNTTSARNDADQEEEGEEGGENDGDANTAALTAREFGANAKTKKKKKKKTMQGETSNPSRRPLHDT